MGRMVTAATHVRPAQSPCLCRQDKVEVQLLSVDANAQFGPAIKSVKGDFCPPRNPSEERPGVSMQGQGKGVILVELDGSGC